MRLLWPLAAPVALAIAIALFHAISLATATAPAPATRDPAYFLKRIFHKYGDDGVISYEGWEHLLESLGLARVQFARRHALTLHRGPDGSFRDLHDALHLHTHHHHPPPDQPATHATLQGGEHGSEQATLHGSEHESHHESEQENHQHGKHASLQASQLPSLHGSKQRGEHGNLKTNHQDSEHASLLGNQQENLQGSEQAFLQDGEQGTHRDRRHGRPGRAEQEAGSSWASGGGGGGGCLSAGEMLGSLGLPESHSVAINTADFQLLCPVLVYELDQRSCQAQPSLGQRAKQDDLGRASGCQRNAWAQASLAVAASGALGLLAAWAAGSLSTRCRALQPALAFLAAAGAGSLSADALLHLLPHALRGPGAELRAAAAAASIAALFALETLLRRLPRAHAHAHAHFGEDESRKTFSEEEMKREMVINGEGGVVEGGGGGGALAWMVVLGDGVHNMTDGAALGAAFCADGVAGAATALAVLCHELPHELGDLAVLLESGMSLKRALFFNALSSALSFVGMALGLWLGNLDAASQWIYAVTAASFLYIALVDILPELSRSQNNTSTSLLQLTGLLCGGGIMLGIALGEDTLRTLFE